MRLANCADTLYTLEKRWLDVGRKRWKTALLILLLAFIWGNSMLSIETSGALSDAVMARMNAAAQWVGLGENFFSFMTDADGDGVEEADSYYIRKAAHVTEFAALGALLRSMQEKNGRRRSLRAFGIAVICAAVDETIQVFSHRGSQFRDVCIDAAGAALGLGIAALVELNKKKKADRAQ